MQVNEFIPVLVSLGLSDSDRYTIWAILRFYIRLSRIFNKFHASSRAHKLIIARKKNELCKIFGDAVNIV